MRINIYDIHIFSTSFLSSAYEISVHPYLFLRVVGEKKLSQNLKVWTYLQNRFCTETAELLPVQVCFFSEFKCYRPEWWDWHYSDSIWNPGWHFVFFWEWFFSKIYKLDIMAIKKLYFFFNQLLNCFLCNSKHSATITF